jgi:hypothetical protein
LAQWKALGGVKDTFSRSFYEFVADIDEWVRPGATSDKIKIPGPKHRKTKIDTGAMRSTSYMMHEALSSNKQVGKAFSKVGEMKEEARLVVSSDNGTYLNMIYFLKSLERLWSVSGMSPLWMGNKEGSQFWEVYAKLLKSGGFTHVPLDETRFDRNKWLSTILAVLDEFLKFVLNNKLSYKYGDDVADSIRRIINKISGGILTDGELVLEIKKGILSGWGLTAWLDTFINMIQMDIAIEVVEKIRGGENGVIGRSHNGDDVWLVTTSKKLAALYLAVYNAMGLDVHPQKTWISTKYDEFLRIYGDKDRVSGYLTRLAAILWAKPGSIPPRTKEERISNIRDNWVKVFQRGGGRSLLPIMIRDLVGASGFTKLKIVSWSFTASSLGGGGFGTHSKGMRMHTSKEEEEEEEGKKNRMELVGKLRTIWNELGYKSYVLPENERKYWAGRVGKSASFRTSIVDVNDKPIYYSGPLDWFDKRIYPSFDRSVPLTGRSEQVIASYREDGLSGVVKYIRNQDKSWVTDMYKRMGRRMWLDWVLGRLDHGSIINPWAGSMSAPYQFNNLVKRVISRVLSKSRPTYNRLRRELVGLEQRIGTEVDMGDFSV